MFVLVEIAIVMRKAVFHSISLAFALSLCCSSCAQTTREDEGQARGKERLLTDSLFAPDSFWYKPIPHDVQLHEQSADFVQEFLRQKKVHYGTVGINTDAYASPVYKVGKDVPTVTVVRHCYNPVNADHALEEQWAQVPIPAGAVPARGTDQEMTIYQPSTDTMWELWKATNKDGQWQACWGGRMQSVSKSPGNWPKYYGTTASGLPFMGGQITAEELRRGEIKHAMGIALVELEHRTIFSWPAKRSDGWNPRKEPNRIPEGLRFRLDPNVDVDALKMHPIGKVIAKAAQKYGFIVWDHGGAITLRAENPLSYIAAGESNPYPALFAGTPQYEILKGFPWDKLQFLPMNYGKPARVPP